MACDHRFTTFERVDESQLPITVRKTSGGVEPFDRAKVIGGVLAATKGRGLDLEAVESIADAVEDAARANAEHHPGPGGGRVEIKSALVGMLVLEQLGAVDEVAYLRFASVYKNFDAAADFHREIEFLSKRSVDSN